MIIVQLAGGLGNQMFQYACGFALATKTGAPLVLDHAFLECRREDYTYREYALNAFGINRRIAVRDMPRLLIKTQGKHHATTIWIRNFKQMLRVLHPLHTVLRNPWHTVYKEEDVTVFDRSFFENGPNQYLRGLFQDERYFAAEREALRREFTFVLPLSGQDHELATLIRSTENAVSVHVRRGDYLTIGSGDVCSRRYYKQAVELLTAKIGNPFFFVFSVDEPEWAEELFASFACRFMIIGNDHKATERGHAHMQLMSLCRHHIIANSTFSWWGAWLGVNPNKIIIAPEPWFGEGYKGPVLPEWITIPRL